MLALPPKRPVGRQTGLGDALSSYAGKTHSGTEANRARAASASLDRCRAAAAEAAEELARGGTGGTSSESAALAVASAAYGDDTGLTEAALENCSRDLRRYARELLAISRRVPDADAALDGFLCEWDDGWATPSKTNPRDATRGLGSRFRRALRNDRKKPTVNKASRQRGGLRLERGATLYNLAACEAAQGCQQDRSSEQGIKRACRHFQRSAGLFEHLRRTTRTAGRRGAACAWGCLVFEDDEADLLDLSSPCLDFCERLCLAQAQACYYEKAVAGQSVAPPIIARLAAHAAHLYWRARAVCSYVPEAENEAKLNELLGEEKCEDTDQLPPSYDTRKGVAGLDASWPCHAEFQARCFEAASSYWAAKSKAKDAEDHGEGYGLQVAYLDRCERECVAALKVASRPGAKRLSQDAIEQITDMRQAAATQRTAVARDNAQIYRETVPNWSDVTQVPRPLGARLAKATVPDACLVGAPGRTPEAMVSAVVPSDEISLLRGLLPRGARSALEAYADRCRRDARECQSRVADADDLVRAALQSLSLPQVVNDVDNAQNFATHGALPKGLRVATASSGEGLFGGSTGSSLLALQKKASELTQARLRSQAALTAARAYSGDASQHVRQRLAQITIDEADDDALLKVVSDDATKQQLAALDGAVGRSTKASVEETLTLSDDVTKAAQACREACSAVDRSGRGRRDAAKRVEVLASEEAQAAAKALDALCDAGLPLVAGDEPEVTRYRDSDDDDDTGDERPEDEDVLPLPPPPTTPRRDDTKTVEASRCVHAFLERRYASEMAPAFSEFAQALGDPRPAVEALASTASLLDEAKRRDPSYRSARDALEKVVAAARLFEELVSRLETRCTAHMNAASEADRRDSPPPKPVTTGLDALLNTANEAAAALDASPSPRVDRRSQEESDAEMARRLAAEFDADDNTIRPPPIPVHQPPPAYRQGQTYNEATRHAPPVPPPDHRQRQELSDAALARQLAEEDERAAARAQSAPAPAPAPARQKGLAETLTGRKLSQWKAQFAKKPEAPVDADLERALAASRAESAPPAPPPPPPVNQDDLDLQRALAASRIESQPRYQAPPRRSQEDDDAALARRLAAEFDAEPAAPPSYSAPPPSDAPPSYNSDAVWNAPQKPPPRPAPSYNDDNDADLQRALAASRAEAPRPQGLFSSLNELPPQQRSYDARPPPSTSSSADYLRRSYQQEYAPPPPRRSYGNSADSYLRQAAQAPPPPSSLGNRYGPLPPQQQYQDPDLPPLPTFGRPPPGWQQDGRGY
mmetsp:Transcript_10666/g.31668  ORF Transcript_10666/g.31668 Transcript_10666/m.31668 type:complete len:1277 (-) Transcript_10666:25-3855(-)